MPYTRDLRPPARRSARRGLLALAAPAALVLAACGDGGGAHEHVSAAPFTGCEVVGGSPTPAAAELTVQLGDFVVVPAAASVASGAVHVRATNIGQHAHELVVVRADEVAALPRAKDGSMAEERLADLALTGEIEEFPPAEQCDAVFDLAPGSYVLLCNLVEKVDGRTVAHLREGMATTFTVTA